MSFLKKNESFVRMEKVTKEARNPRLSINYPCDLGQVV